MANENNECVVGLLHHYEDSELVTISELKDHIEDNREFNRSLDDDPCLRNAVHLRKKVWTLADYGNWRKNTNLTRFSYCPQCGKYIDWKAIRGMQDGK